MRVLVHAGMPKTGSSAIQEYLAQSRDELTAQRTSYPDLGHRGHWMLAAALSSSRGKFHHARRRLDADEAEESLDGARERVGESLSSLGSSSDAVILSHEGLSVGDIAKRLTPFLDEHTPASTETKIVAYVRHPVSLYTSAIQQALKAETDRTLLPHNWRSTHLQRAERIRPIFRDRLHLRPFAPPSQPGWDAVDDFRTFAHEFLQKELPQSRDHLSVNTSLSAQACAALEALRDSGFDAALQKQVRRSLRRFDAGYASKKKLAPPADWTRDIASANAQGWNALVSTLDCDEAAREAMRIEPEPLSRQYQDKDIKDWLLAGLGADWLTDYTASIADAGFKPAVFAWVARLRDAAASST